jgi:hypothetical protein
VYAFTWKQKEALQMKCDFKTISGTFAKNKLLLATVGVIIFLGFSTNCPKKKSGFLVEKQGLITTIIWPIFLLQASCPAKLELRLPRDESTDALYMLWAMPSFRFISFKPQV